MKCPIGIQTSEKIIEEGYVYVDKTALVYDLVKNGTVYLLSRTRRFGKSLLLSTLKAYFDGRKDLFRGLAMERLETEWAEYTAIPASCRAYLKASRPTWRTNTAGCPTPPRWA